MALSGKYDFAGLKQLGAAGLRTMLAASKLSFLLKGGGLTDAILEFIANYLANSGLVILNVGAIYVSGHFDQKAFDSAFEKAITEIKTKGGSDALSPEEKRAIDDEIIKAARKFVVIAKESQSSRPGDSDSVYYGG